MKPPSEGTDAVFLGTTVIHRARIWYHTQSAWTACGTVLIGFTSQQLDTEGEFTDAYLEFVNERDGTSLALCWHCRERTPIWEQWKQRAKRKTDRSERDSEP